MSIEHNGTKIDSSESAKSFVNLMNTPRQGVEKVRNLMNTLIGREGNNAGTIESVPVKLSISDKTNLFNQYQLGYISKEELDAGLKALGKPKTQTVGNPLFTFETER